MYPPSTGTEGPVAGLVLEIPIELALSCALATVCDPAARLTPRSVNNKRFRNARSMLEHPWGGWDSCELSLNSVIRAVLLFNPCALSPPPAQQGEVADEAARPSLREGAERR